MATRIQTATGSTASGTSFTVTFGSSPTNGNSLQMTIGTTGVAAAQVTSISQTGATWVKAKDIDNTAGAENETWYAENISGAGTVATVNLAGTLNAIGIGVEYSGLSTSSSIDLTASSQGTNPTTPTTGTTGTTNQANELWFGGVTNLTGTTFSAASNGFTIITQTTVGAISLCAVEKIVTSTGTAGTSLTFTSLPFAWQYAGTIATFKDAITANKSNFFMFFR